MNLLAIFSPIFWGLLVLSLLVFVHEAGHYGMARLCGVRVTEFFLGMPFRYKLSHKSKKYGTEVGVTPLLFGGYTRICGMEGELDELLPQALMSVQEAGTLEVGTLATKLNCEDERAFSLLYTLADWGSIELVKESESDELAHTAFRTLARDAELRCEYDRGHNFELEGSTAAGEPRVPQMSTEEFFAQEKAHTYVGVNVPKRLLMILGGPLVNIALAFLLVVGSLMFVGVPTAQNKAQLGSVESNSLAAISGLNPGDTILTFNGVEVHTWEELTVAIKEAMSAGGKDIPVTYDRGGIQLETTIKPVLRPDDKIIGVSPVMTTYHFSFIDASAAAVSYAAQVGQFALRLLIPTQTMEVLNQSSSVVGISVMASKAAAEGFSTFIMLVAAISMSLGFMNLLPIPPLDGGKILIEIIQIIVRKPLSIKVQNILSYIGLAFFLFVFVVALRNDILHLLFR